MWDRERQWVGKKAVWLSRLWVVGFGWVWGCGGDDSYTLTFDEKCELLQPSACNISRRDCQEHLWEFSRCLWDAEGGSISMPEIREISASTFEDEYRADLEAYEEEISEHRRVLSQAYDWALLQLGLVQAEDLTLEASVERVSEGWDAYYSSRDRSITILERDRRDAVRSSALLIHEFVHALQHERYDLVAIRRKITSYDEWLAHLCLTEGDATLQEIRAALTFRGERSVDAYLAEVFTQYVPNNEQWLFEEPRQAWLKSQYAIPYSHGGRWVFQAWRRGGMRAIGDLYAAPPRTLQQVLTLDRQISEVADWEEPGEDELIVRDRLGAWSAYLVNRALGTSSSRRIIDDWRDDRLDVHVREDGLATLTWQIEFAAEGIAESFARAVFEPASNLSVEWSEEDGVSIGWTTSTTDSNLTAEMYIDGKHVTWWVSEEGVVEP